MFRKMEGGGGGPAFESTSAMHQGWARPPTCSTRRGGVSPRGTDVVVGAVRFGQAVEVVGETPKRYRIRAVDPRGTSVSTTLGGGRRHVERADRPRPGASSRFDNARKTTL